MRIFVNLEFDQKQRDFLEARAVGDEIHFGNPEDFSDEDRIAFLASEVAFGWCPPELLLVAKQLGWFQLESVGYEPYSSLNWDDSEKKPTVTNLRGFFSVPVAETAIAGVLTIYRGIDSLINLKLAKTWKQLELRPQLRTLGGAKVLLVGYGGIGQALAQRLRAFQCEVRTFGRKVQGTDFSTLTELDANLPDADIVILSLPQTEETIGMFDRHRLDLLKKDAMLVNVGRGTILDEVALVDALTSGGIMGAVIDVTATEPLPRDHVFWNVPNLLLTQHTAGGFVRELDAKIDFFLENLQHYRNGTALENVVNL